MTIRADNQRRRQLPYGIVTLWSAYVLMFLGGVYLLAHEHAAVHHAAAYANESILYGELLGMNAADMARYTAEGILY